MSAVDWLEDWAGDRAGDVAGALASELHLMAGWLGLSEVAVAPRGTLAARLAPAV